MGGVQPCIVKPVLSHEGSKGDIKKCNTNEELVSYLKQLEIKGYKQCLVQEYIDYEYQYVIHGAMLRHSREIPFILLKNLREWPTTGGTGTFRCFVNDGIIVNGARDILNRIYEYGYRGLFDIEFFERKGEIILNEVNFRSSGVGYSVLSNKVHYPYFYYLDATGKNCKINTDYYSKHYVMNAMADINHVRYGELSLFKWINNVIKTRDFSCYYRKDLRPTAAYFSRFVKNRFK